MRDEIMQSIRAALVAHGLDAAAANAMVRRIRKEFGGTKHYIASTSPEDRAAQRQLKRHARAPSR
jgi:hypothetical protein